MKKKAQDKGKSSAQLLAERQAAIAASNETIVVEAAEQARMHLERDPVVQAYIKLLKVHCRLRGKSIDHMFKDRLLERHDP